MKNNELKELYIEKHQVALKLEKLLNKQREKKKYEKYK